MVLRQKPSVKSSVRKLAIVIDVGTTKIKCLVFDDQLHVAYERETPAKVNYMTGGRVEQDAVQIYQTVYELLDDAVANNASAHVTVGLTTQRESVVMWDRVSGKVLHPLISWEDSRTKKLCQTARYRTIEPIVRTKTGMYVNSYPSATKMRWLLDNVRTTQNTVLGTLDSWLIFQLTGQFLTDYTNASRTLLYNIRTKRWDDELLHFFGVPATMLASVQPSKSNFGSIKLSKCKVPLRAVIGDQQASLYAAGYVPGTMKITHGTGIFPMKVIGTRFQIKDQYITTLAATPHKQPLYALETKVDNAAASVTPVLDNPKQLEKTMKQLAEKTAKVARPLLNTSTKEIIVDGGISQNDTILQVEANLLGVPIRRLPIHNGTALGVAKLIFS